MDFFPRNTSNDYFFSLPFSDLSIMSTSSNNSNEHREQGNQAFKQGQFQKAIDHYTDALKILADLPLSDTIKTDLTKCYSNRAQCYINLEQYEDAIEDATRGNDQ